MVSLLFLVSALLLGTALTRRLNLRLLPFEAPALSIVLGLVLWTWLSFICSLLLPYAYSLPLTVLLAATATALLWRRGPNWHWQALPGGRPARTAWAIFTAATTLLFARLMWTHDLPRGVDGIYSANSTWADFGLHASLISHFAAATRLPLDFPLAAGTHLTYPFMVDLLSGWLVYGGWTLHAALLVPSLLLVAAFLQLMIGFGIRLFGSVGGAIAGLTLALFSGSAAGIYTALKDFSASHLTITGFFQHLPQDYTALTLPNAQVTNFIADILLPQRAFLMGAAVFAAVLVLLTELRRHPSRRLAWLVGGLVGLLPLIHAHTFVVLLAIMAGLGIESLLAKRPAATSAWIQAGAAAIIVGLPQILWQIYANGRGTGGHFALGWTINPGEPLLGFWMNNYGLMLVIILGIGALLTYRKSLRKYLAWYAPLLALFIFANIYSMQPFAYDNLKLIMYVYLVADIGASYGAMWLVRRYKDAAVPLALIAVLLCGSGFLAVTREFQHRDQFASLDDIALSDWVTSSTASDDVFITTDRPNQPIPTLAGRPIVAGYRGWLYNYNFNYQSRLDDIAQALRGNLTASNPYRAKYLAVGAYEPAEWAVDRTALQSRYTMVYANDSWTVYLLP